MEFVSFHIACIRLIGIAASCNGGAAILCGISHMMVMRIAVADSKKQKMQLWLQQQICKGEVVIGDAEEDVGDNDSELQTVP